MRSSRSPGRPRWAARLTRWYLANARAMPWRGTRDPYRIWISEVMLQQTRVDAVRPYYERFLSRFPTLTALADADQQDVLRAWQGLGYYSRARNLHRAAGVLVREHAGSFPQTARELRTLPGVGAYTSAAVASLAFDEAVPVVDGNVLRAFARFFGLEEDIRKAGVRRALAERLAPHVAEEGAAVFNQAMMELGALVCTPRRPACARCPIASDCVARRDGRTEELPVKRRAARIPHVEIGVGVIWRRGKILIGRRREDQMLGGLWEFPGGKRLPGESLERTAAREIVEETGLDPIVGLPYTTVEHTYSHFRITMTAFRCEAPRGRAVPKSAEELRWVDLAALDGYPFPAASLRVIRAVREAETRRRSPKTPAAPGLDGPSHR